MLVVGAVSMTTFADRIPFWTPLHTEMACEAFEQAWLEVFTEKALAASRNFGDSAGDGFNVAREELFRSMRRRAEQKLAQPFDNLE